MPGKPSFLDDYEEGRRSLTPLFAEAAQAQAEFKAAWKNGESLLGFEAYKRTEQYGKTLERHHTPRTTLDQRIDPVIQEIKRGDCTHLALAMAYLGVNGRYFRSGYTRSRLCRALKRVSLEPEVQTILREIILDHLQRPGASNLELWSLIPKVVTPPFDRSIRSLLESPSRFVRERISGIIARHLGPLRS